MLSFFDAKWPVFTVSAGMHHPDYQLYAIIYKFANEYGGIPVTDFCEKSPSRAASLWGTKIVIFSQITCGNMSKTECTLLHIHSHFISLPPCSYILNIW